MTEIDNDIGWEKYEAKGTDLRGGLSPDGYIHSIRDEDRKEIR